MQTNFKQMQTNFKQMQTNKVMSEEQKITTTEKVKNPKRVEQGRRLAAISKEAKARKAEERKKIGRRMYWERKPSLCVGRRAWCNWSWLRNL